MKVTLQTFPAYLQAESSLYAPKSTTPSLYVWMAWVDKEFAVLFFPKMCRFLGLIYLRAPIMKKT